MFSKPLLFLGYFALVLWITSNALARAKDDTAGILTISIFNDASVPAEVLVQAEGRASRILSHAGIQVEWLNCVVGDTHIPDQFEHPSACNSIAYPSHLSVRIVPSGKSVREDIFGEAFADGEGKGAYINLFYAHLAKSNASGFLGEGELLGYVIAHEVGHLLLGTDSHGNEGIMQGRWESAQLKDAGKGNLQFTQPQAALMRGCLAGRSKSEVLWRSVEHNGRIAE